MHALDYYAWRRISGTPLERQKLRDDISAGAGRFQAEARRAASASSTPPNGDRRLFDDFAPLCRHA